MSGANPVTLLVNMGIDQATAEKFHAWHKAHPEIWIEFERLALQAIAEGHERWSANGIAEVVRWNMRLKKSDAYLFNNNYRAYYARIFILKHPQHRAFFELRPAKGLKSKEDEHHI